MTCKTNEQRKPKTPKYVCVLYNVEKAPHPCDKHVNKMRAAGTRLELVVVVVNAQLTDSNGIPSIWLEIYSNFLCFGVNFFSVYIILYLGKKFRVRLNITDLMFEQKIWIWLMKKKVIF